LEQSLQRLSAGVAIALLAASCQQPIDHGADAVAWYAEVQQGGGQAAACLPTTIPTGSDAIAGDFRLKSTRLEPMNIDDPATTFRHENILTNGPVDIYIYGWRPDEFMEATRSIYEMVGAEPPSEDGLSTLKRCFVFSTEAL
jgi:hypothetical protein